MILSSNFINDKDNLSIAESYIQQIEEMDPSSFAFSYPLDKELKINHTEK